MPSAASTSAGAMRPSSPASCCGATSASRSSPLARDSHARPTVALSAASASSTLSDLLVQQRRVGERARRDDARHLALDRPLGARDVAHLLADRDRFAQLHQPGEVLLGRVPGHARHPDRLPGRGAAGGERDVEQARGALGVVVEQLVEIPHAVEQEDVRVLRLDAQVLLHHGRVCGQSVAGVHGARIRHPRGAPGAGRGRVPGRGPALTDTATTASAASIRSLGAAPPSVTGSSVPAANGLFALHSAHLKALFVRCNSLTSEDSSREN